MTRAHSSPTNPPEVEYCADAIAQYGGKFVIVERKTPPFGLALPGGRIDSGENAEACAIREFREETGLAFTQKGVLGIYDDPDRDPRGRKISTVFYGDAHGIPRDAEGETKVIFLAHHEILARRKEFAFDHFGILCDYFRKIKQNIY